MFIPNNGGFWRNQEQANQFVHGVFGFWASYILWISGFGYFSLLGFLIGVLELIRQLVFDKPEINKDFVQDKIRDNCFYLLGSLMTLIIKFFPVV